MLQVHAVTSVSLKIRMEEPRGTMASMAAIIKKISVENFLSYDSTIIEPGPNFNLIIGPNGSGKSAIICAIILGLGGQIKSIGRAPKIVDFIKYGRERARIEIYLNNPGDEDHVVTRTWWLSSHDKWCLNGNTVSTKEVAELLNNLNIQVDNLCQFLPQDKINDFAKMQPQEVLINTERSVADPSIVGYHVELQNLTKQLAISRESITNKKNTLSQRSQEYERLMQIVGRIEERSEMRQKLLYLRQKKAWLSYAEIGSELLEARKVRDAAAQEMNRLLETTNEMNESVAKIKAETDAAKDSLNSQQTAAVSGIWSIVESIESYGEDVREMEKSLVRDLQAQVIHEQEIATTRQQKNKLENDLEHITQEFQNEESLVEKEKQTSSLIEEYLQVTIEAASKMYDVEAEKYQIGIQSSDEECRLKEAIDIDTARLRLLKAMSPHSYEGVIWLRQNKHKFAGTIHVPMLLTINIQKATYGKYFAHLIRNEDLCAFICENREDVDALVQYLNTENLSINCLYFDPEKFVDLSPTIAITSLAEFGLQKYLISLIEAPQLILKFLVLEYGINNIPIGSFTVEKHHTKIADTLICWFSPKHCYTISTSRYTGDICTKTSQLSDDDNYIFVIPDTKRVAKLETRLASLNEKKEAATFRAAELQKQHTEAEEKLKELRAQRMEYARRVTQITIIRARIRMLEQKINDLEAQRTSIEDIKETNKRQINDILMNQMRAYQQYNETLEEYIKTIQNSPGVELKLKLLRRTLTIRQNEYREMKSRCTEAERTVRNSDNDLQSIGAEEKRMYDYALNSTNGLRPGHPDFEKFNTAFSKLPPTIAEINDELKVTQAKVFCLGDASDEGIVLKDLEKVRMDVENLKQKIEAETAQLQNIIQRMEDLYGKWMPPLRRLVDAINENFSSYLASMNCAGEAAISHGENIMDFEKYGLTIKVKFRDTDELQQLSRNFQSGGERTVTTAMYLTALQELSIVPFRCVDEINQGMDAINERRVLELIMRIAGKPDGPQYFLAAQKLPLGLQYPETARIFCVFNGPFSISQKKFDSEKYFKELCSQQPRQ